MNKTTPKIILDRSIFHGDNISILQKSNLNNMCAENKILLYGNPILLEETENLWFKKRREEMSNHFKYLLKITNGRWFRTQQEILANELANKNDDWAYFYSMKETYETKQTIKRLIRGEIEIEKIKERQNAINALYQKKKEHRDDRIIKSRNYLKMVKKGREHSLGEESFDALCSIRLEEWAGGFIRRNSKSKIAADIIVTHWKENMGKYPYFTFWMKGFIYMRYHPITKTNAKYDLNAEADIAQLGLMKWVDMLVSNDQSFQKDAFMQLCGKDKKYLSLEEFISYLNKI